MSKYDHYTEFNNNLHNFAKDIYHYTKSSDVKRFLDVYKKIDKHKLIQYYVKKTTPISFDIKDKNDAIFSKKFIVFPGIDMNLFWDKLKPEQKEKMWIYMHLLYLSSNMVVELTKKEENKIVVNTKNNEDNEEKMEKIDQIEVSKENSVVVATEKTETISVTNNIDNTIEKVTKVETSVIEFDPFVGIGTNTATYDIKNIMSGANNLENKPPSAGAPLFSLSTFTQGFGLDKYMDKLMDQLKNINEADINKAIDNLKTHFGTDIDDNTSKLLTGMLTDITDEFKTSNLKNGNPLDNIQNIAMNVAQKMVPKIKSSGIDKDKIEKSFTNLLNKYKTNATNETGGSPQQANIINGLLSMMDKMKTMGNTNTEDGENDENKSSEPSMNDINELLKSSGLNIDLSKMDMASIMKNLTRSK